MFGFLLIVAFQSMEIVHSVAKIVVVPPRERRVDCQIPIVDPVLRIFEGSLVAAFD